MPRKNKKSLVESTKLNIKRIRYTKYSESKVIKPTESIYLGFTY